MPRLTKISLTQFKNYSFSSFNFTERVIGICGHNGRGKTNLLDAIYYTCFTKSYFGKTDIINVQFDTDGFRLEAVFETEKVVLINRLGGKKELLLNDKVYEKFSKHIGKFPAVMIAPDDVELITGGSEGRRRFIDTVISQVDEQYLLQLIMYNKVLQQRNSLLKRFAEQGSVDWALLEVLDEQLIIPGTYIFTARKTFLLELMPLANEFYNTIAANGEEQLTLNYESQLHINDFKGILKQFQQKDMILQRSNGGIHKDDISILLNGQVFKNIASQGQRKSLLFALKLAEFQLLKIKKGFAPILLLDDVFEKLDAERMHQLLHWVCVENDGQVFITDTHKERLESAFASLGNAFQLIEL
jgi:DNA replication and repair protein RecF